ncbi:hypothetical protein KDL01_38120 [Actinospica durhamensis]|uniref:Uncharacterized protein n=1 Tax=Actinospica durhamensis TaxID=1508375 RepID=A0A941IUI3_9ACTN|nr:hypothetical protein [Actinospica durhamensis]MBR7839142.1 hypothetical protein [Actinospica durhamensis]
MDFKLAVVQGPDPAEVFAGLVQWLGDEEELRGALRTESAPIEPGHLGFLADTLVVMLGGGAAVGAVIGSLRGFFSRPQHRDALMVFERPDGQQLEFGAGQIDHAEAFLRRALEQQE